MGKLREARRVASAQEMPNRTLVRDPATLHSAIAEGLRGGGGGPKPGPLAQQGHPGQARKDPELNRPRALQVRGACWPDDWDDLGHSHLPSDYWIHKTQV